MQASSWEIGQHMSRLKDLSQTYRPSTIIGDIYREFGINLSYRKTWKSKERAFDLIRGSPKYGYGNLASCCYILEKNNPGTTYIQTDQDANGQIYPIAWALVDSENYSSWLWFMSKLKEQIGDSNRLVFISDRDKSITKAIRVIFPQSHHGHCIWHMEQHIKRQKHMTHLTPKLEEILRKTLDDSSTLKVNPVTAHEFQVGLDTNNMDVVNVAQRTCSCKKFEILEIPCRHAHVVAISRGILIYSLWSEYYKTTSWRTLHAGLIHPIDNHIDWLIPDEVQGRVILPPCVRRPCGRPQTRRMRFVRPRF
ncbi:uncharacterized protein [Henckelia pumila]|uniref:uncharacterized protein n=1 Tax=Henckelia pumila TaxID=405737 RepID=UPI003C6DCC07